MPTEISIATRNSKWTPLSPPYIMHIRWIRSARLEPVGEWEQIKKWVYWSSFWKPIYKPGVHEFLITTVYDHLIFLLFCRQ